MVCTDMITLDWPSQTRIYGVQNPQDDDSSEEEAPSFTSCLRGDGRSVGMTYYTKSGDQWPISKQNQGLTSIMF